MFLIIILVNKLHTEREGILVFFIHTFDSPGGSEGKESACNAGDPGSIPGLGRSPGEGNGNPLQYSCLKIPMAGGAWQATVHGVAKSWTQLSNFTSSLCYETSTKGISSGKVYITFRC